MDILRVNNVTKRYKDVEAVKGLSLAIHSGDIHGILGPNGAGKSTLLSCVVGLNKPDNGEILFEEKEKFKAWSANIGYVPQELAIYPELSAYENIKFFASLYGLKGKELEERVLWSLDFVGLSDVKDKASSQFSGGMKRRLNLACAISHKPKLIIMDEPTVGIDPQSRNRILENVKSLNEQGCTIIYTTHYMEEAEAICKKVTVMDKGQVIAEGSKEKIMAMMGTENTYSLSVDAKYGNWEGFLQELRTEEMISEIMEVEAENQVVGELGCLIKGKNKDMVHRVFGLTQKHKLVLKNVEHSQPSLEEVFLELTGKDLRDEE